MGSAAGKGWDGEGEVEQGLPTKLCRAPGPRCVPSRSQRRLDGRFNPNWKSSPSRCGDGHFTPVMRSAEGCRLQLSLAQHPSAAGTASLRSPQQGGCSPPAVAGARGVRLNVT